MSNNAIMSKPRQADWLGLVDNSQQAALVRLLAGAPRLRQEEVSRMLTAGPWPTDADDAKARAVTVVRYLTSGYRVGDPHPTTESTEASYETQE